MTTLISDRAIAEVPSRYAAAAVGVLDASDAASALAENAVPPVVRAHLERILHRGTVVGLPVSVAARVLDVTAPTVRSWITRGILEVVEGVHPVQVTASSVGEAHAAVSAIREAGDDRRLLARTLDYLEDTRTRRELAGRIAAIDDRVAVDTDDLESLYT